MTVLSYIFSTILLSWMGIAAYGLLTRLNPSISARRATLWFVLALSLTLPLTPPFTQTNYRHISIHRNGKVDVGHEAHLGPANVKDFCQCEDPHAGDVILYQTSRIYDFLLVNQFTLWIVLTGIGGLLMLRIFVKLGGLLIRMRRYRAESIDLLGHRIHIVRDMPGISAASLRLGGKFIFWNQSLDTLPAADQQAILAHELSHLLQRNSWEKTFLAVLQMIWWVNPAFYFISKELELLSEYAADAFAVEKTGNAKQYATLLLRMKTSETFAPVQFFRGSRLKRRIEKVLKSSRQPRLQLVSALIVWIVLVTPGELLAKQIVKEQLQDIEVYEFLTERNQETGQIQFCRKCTYEVWQNCYTEPIDDCSTIPAD